MTPDRTINFFVPGIPRPGGSKTATVIRRKGGEIVMKNGRPLITTRDDAKGNAEWKSLVSYFARQAYTGVPLDCPLLVRLHFTMPRLKGHFGSGRNAGVLKPTAPTHHTTKPDVLKLARSTEDACTGILWRDDSCTSKLELEKVYGDRPGVQITVTPLADIAQAAPVPAPAELFAERRAS